MIYSPLKRCSYPNYPNLYLPITNPSFFIYFFCERISYFACWLYIMNIKQYMQVCHQFCNFVPFMLLFQKAYFCYDGTVVSRMIVSILISINYPFYIRPRNYIRQLSIVYQYQSRYVFGFWKLLIFVSAQVSRNID